MVGYILVEMFSFIQKNFATLRLTYDCFLAATPKAIG
jgi:hypothetical protein